MRKHGFTLIELLVVIGIIVLLIGILVPALGVARIRGQAARTSALMVGLQASIEGYYADFNGYPGPMDQATVSGTAPGGAGSKVSGAQNLLMGLSCRITDGNTIPHDSNAKVQIPGASGIYIDPTTRVGPVNYGSRDPITGSPKQHSGYFEATDKQISRPTVADSTKWPPGGVLDQPDGKHPAWADYGQFSKFPFPVIVDAFADGMPILYYRRTPGVDTGVGPNNSSSNAYDWRDNREYTEAAALTSTAGTVFYEHQGPDGLPPRPPSLGSAVNGPQTLQKIAQSGTSNSLRGGYILISAGPDHYYGNMGIGGASDDIIVVGGN